MIQTPRPPMAEFVVRPIPVAILGSDRLDVTEIDATTLAFGPAGASPVHKRGGHLEDVNGDSLADLISHYGRAEIGLSARDRDACVTGETLGGIPFRGCDAIRIVGPRCGLGYELSFALAAGMWLRARRRERSLISASSARNPARSS